MVRSIAAGRRRALTRAALALSLVCATWAPTACDRASDAESASHAAHTPSVEPLEAARGALEARRWREAIQHAGLALEAQVETEAARAIIAQARAEAANQARLNDAHALFVAEQYGRAYQKLLDFSPDSVYAGQVANMLVRIRHAAVLPEAIARADEMPMRRVVIGSFQRGSDAAEAQRAHKLCEKYTGECQLHWYDREQPRRRVVTGSFYIDEREVSVGQYRRCVRDGGCTAIDWAACGLASDAERAPFDGAELPQVCVTWHEAARYCEHYGARLPTEAEWEHAAAGPRNRRFPWGDAWNALAANWADGGTTDGFAGLAPVDAFASGARGLRNMAGNAYEWTADWYAEDYYASAPETDPQGPAEGVMRVIRGGAYTTAPSSLRVAHRNRMDPGDRDRTVGFRCAASPERLPAGR